MSPEQRASSSESPDAADKPDLDARFMGDALMLGQRNQGRTWPNPSVGAVLIKQAAHGPIVVGRGNTQPGGRPHAETQALQAAGDAARGATLYVSLEPCAHHGKTPPCADAVISAGVARVVSALEDPNPRVAGQGHRRLREAGIAVTLGVLSTAARRAHRGHIVRTTNDRPAVTLKLARTADGYAARRRGPRLFVTGDATNVRLQLIRMHADAVLVGLGTVLADDPQLTLRLPGLASRSPVRVVFDTALRTPPTAFLALTAGKVPTWIVTSDAADTSAADALEARGVEIIRVPAEVDGHVDPAAALKKLAERGITRVLCEGGPKLAGALAAGDLIDEIILATSFNRLGEPGLLALDPGLAALVGDASRMTPYDTVHIGPDTLAFFERPA